ncbi:hypothetical protein [Rhodospirillaceae bacterium SYSU D60014]|uniref:hypothetical protein n=1 Tax=Virgifigura deserti TaxID=2268457 RepID=UPI0013C5383E
MTAVLPEDSFRYEEAGQVLICRRLDRCVVEGEYDNAFLVRLGSRSADKRHPILESLRGKRVRITVEVEDDAPMEDPLGKWGPTLP